MEKVQEALSRIPHEPGVYVYRNAKREIIYIGKAVDLAKRVKQYFQRDHHLVEKTARLVSEIDTIETIPTTSEFDALLLEAKLIRQHLPKYNVVARDDKSPLYVALTLSEELPRLLLIRKGDVPLYEKKSRNRVYGPFQSGFALRTVLRQLRSIVPYCTQKDRRGKPCFYTHLGLCHPCPAHIVSLSGVVRQRATSLYRRHMLQLNALFTGKTRWLARQYEKEMRRLAEALQFEEAGVVKERLRSLNGLSSYRYDPEVFLDRGASDVYEEELGEFMSTLKRYYPSITRISRIECFDVSNLFGAYAVGSMVVLTQGKPNKGEYKRFRIRSVRGISDVAMMRELLRRRFNHPEWPYPDLMLVDGGKPQVTAALAVIPSDNEGSPSIPLAGLAKREEELIIPTPTGFATLRLPLSGRAIKPILRVRDEAHRFAITYHRILRAKGLTAQPLS
jgi:excinuclease ABC subunit C